MFTPYKDGRTGLQLTQVIIAEETGHDWFMETDGAPTESKVTLIAKFKADYSTSAYFEVTPEGFRRMQKMTSFGPIKLAGRPCFMPSISTNRWAMTRRDYENVLQRLGTLHDHQKDSRDCPPD